MAYQALYRTYRPHRFSNVIGQDHVVRTLLNSVKQNKVGHAYLFSGPRGTGKTTVARLLARTINCESPVDGEPCGECVRCKGSEEGLGVLEIDAASHGSVDDMRQLVAQVSQIPLSGGMMVYIIDEVHMLSKEAFNAFLKTLEEPPPHAVFVLATTEPGKLLPTIHSRCQHFSFHRIPVDIIARHIENICEKEGVVAESTALRLIARAADGSVRDSISILEQAIAYEPEGLTLDGVRDVLGIPDRLDIRTLGGYLIDCDPGGLSSSFAGLIESGREPASILTELLSHFRDLLFASLDIGHSDLEMLPEEERRTVNNQAEKVSIDDIHWAITSLGKCNSEIKWEDEAALIMEAFLLRMASRFGREPKTETAYKAPVEAEPVSQAEATFPDAASRPPAKLPGKEPERPSLTGGKSLKRKTAPAAPPEAKPHDAEKKAVTKPAAQTVSDESKLLVIPEDIDPFWKNTLESIREISVTEYILLAEAIPSPAPSEWPETKGADTEPLSITLKYPFARGFLVKLINESAVMNRITSRLEEVLERPLTLRVARERGKSGGEEQSVMYNGEGHVAGSNNSSGPSLFPGAGRPVPSDPDIKKIHNLIAEDFPDYEVKGNSGN